MKSIRWRVFTVVLLALVSVFFLVPRTVTQRQYDAATGAMVDRTERRVPIDLGLDLNGGVHLALEVDQTKGPVADCKDAIKRAEHVVRTRMDEFGTAERVVQIVGDCRLVVELPGMSDPARARDIVQRTAFLEFRLTDKDDRLKGAFPSLDAAARRSGALLPVRDSARTQTMAELFEPAQGGGTGDTVAAVAGGFSQLLQQGQRPGEYLVAEEDVPTVEKLLASPEVQRALPRGVSLHWAAQDERSGASAYRPLYVLESRPIITGEDLVNATAGNDPETNAVEVRFDLSRTGGRNFAAATERNIGNFLAIVLDGRVQGAPPVIESRIESSGRIEMRGRSLEEAHDLALVLRAGALPVPLQVVEERTIGPTLGAESIRAGVQAALLSVVGVLLIIGVYYRLAGVFAVSALFFYILYCMGGLAAFGFTLTLPGLAGFALSIGMAVDANVLIFERIREELAAKKPISQAVDAGFRHAMSAIVDSNVTTALTALILYVAGTISVRGFAVTLMIGLLASMISAIFVTRTFFEIWLTRRPKTLRFHSIPFFEKARYDIIGLRRWAYGISVALIVPGILLIAARGARYSIEFTGGALVQVQTNQPSSTGALRSALETGGLNDAEVQNFGSNRDFVVRARLAQSQVTEQETDAVAQNVRAALDRGLGANQYQIEQTERVGPKVGAELQQKAWLAILLSFATTLIYLAFRFEWKFGTAAVLATAHDILATIAFISYLNIEVSLVVVAGILTVLGYSLNDTIVVFDRVRERLRMRRGSMTFIDVLNLSVNETLPRTILTGGATLFSALVLATLGGAVIQPFAQVLTFGIIVGTFSSIFVAAPVLLWLTRPRAKPVVAAEGVRA